MLAANLLITSKEGPLFWLSWVRVTRSLVLCVCSVDRCFFL